MPYRPLATFIPVLLLLPVSEPSPCAAAFEPEHVCPGDQPTNVSDSIFKERVVVFDEAMGARVVVAGDINKDGRNDLPARLEREIEEQREAARRGLEESTTGATKRSWGSSSSRSGSMDSTGVTSLTTGSKAARFSFLRSFSTKGSQAQLGQQNSLVSLDSYAFPTHEKSVTLSAATTRSKVAAMQLEASAGDGDEDALSPV